jgi:hypothetical protein
MEIKKSSKIPQKYICEKCDYVTCYSKDYKKHLLTKKHMEINGNSKEIKKVLFCENCEKEFKTNSGLWKHTQKCINNNDMMNDGINIKDKDALVVHLLKQNTEIIKGQQDMLIKLTENNMNTNNNSNNISNSMNNNKTFNLNVFLNETCKDAMNISDFVSSIKLNLDDLEHTGRQGYVQGITNIVLKNLNNVEQHMRPLHCSDVKREILYIKDNNEWTKETEEKPILTKAIKTIANENIKQIKNWRDKYPDCSDVDSKKNNLYLKIVSNSMNGLTKEEGNKNINKIISNVVKEVTIDKDTK